MSTLDPAFLLAAGWLLIGLAAGALLQRSHFCIMGAIADLVLFGSGRRIRVWALAIAVAVLGTQLAAGAGLLPLEASGHLARGLALGPALLGGFLFGFGMVLTGGCASRTLVRAAEGSLKALVVLLVMALAGWAAWVGVLAPAHELLRGATSWPLAAPEGPALWRPLLLLGFEPATARLVTALLVAGGLAFLALADPRLRARPADLLTGAALGGLVVAGWLLTGWLAVDPFAPPAPASLSYVGPIGQSLLLVATGEGGGSGPWLVAGTAAGAFATAAASRALRLEGFATTADLARHLVGAALMGTGGVLAMGCTIGQGLSGLSTLSAGSLLATLAIVAGAARALAWLETGRLLPQLRLPGRRSARAAPPLAGAAGRGYVVGGGS